MVGELAETGIVVIGQVVAADRQIQSYQADHQRTDPGFAHELAEAAHELAEVALCGSALAGQLEEDVNELVVNVVNVTVQVVSNVLAAAALAAKDLPTGPLIEVRTRAAVERYMGEWTTHRSLLREENTAVQFVVFVTLV